MDDYPTWEQMRAARLRHLQHDYVGKRFSVPEYDALVADGSFYKDDPIELVRGVVVWKLEKGLSRQSVQTLLLYSFIPLVGGDALVSIESPLQLDDRSEVEPDCLLYKPPLEQYRERQPRPQDTILVVEIADKITGDRSDRVQLYAEAGVPAVWLIDLVGETVRSYSQPLGGSYREARVAKQGEEIALPGQLTGSVEVAELLD